MEKVVLVATDATAKDIIKMARHAEDVADQERYPVQNVAGREEFKHPHTRLMWMPRNGDYSGFISRLQHSRSAVTPSQNLLEGTTMASYYSFDITLIKENNRWEDQVGYVRASSKDEAIRKIKDYYGGWAFTTHNLESSSVPDQVKGTWVIG